MARKDIKEETDYHGRGDVNIIVEFDNSSDLIWICLKHQGSPIRKDSTIKDISISVFVQVFLTGSM